MLSLKIWQAAGRAAIGSRVRIGAKQRKSRAPLNELGRNGPVLAGEGHFKGGSVDVDFWDDALYPTFRAFYFSLFPNFNHVTC